MPRTKTEGSLLSRTTRNDFRFDRLESRVT